MSRVNKTPSLNCSSQQVVDWSRRLCCIFTNNTCVNVPRVKDDEMDEYHNEGSFNTEEADSIVKECIENVVGGDDYNQNLVNKWTSAIVERCLTQLVKLGKQYKFIVTCALMQKTGAGLHTANSCYWDTAMDVSSTVRWESRTMYCVVSVFAVAVA
uniref:Dynein light chain Tctex-type 3 n=2 Tax=Hippocampus comes TaxID=109280 RepID=A0A3Q2XMP4_HIPCM